MPLSQNYLVSRVFCIVAAAFLLLGGFWPIFGTLPGRGVQAISVISVGVLVGVVLLGQGSNLVFTLLWAALGLAVATGTIGVFSVGFVYLIAAVLVGAAIAVTPNETDTESRAAWRFVCGFFIAYVISFAIAFSF